MDITKQKILVVAAVAAFLFAGIIFIQLNYSEDELPQDSFNQTRDSSDQEIPQNTVYFTDSGFTPSTLTIERGEEVTFVNNASNTMWVGSDQHPTHTEYDGTSVDQHCGTEELVFDQCETGDRFNFQFDKTGTFGYHNHRPFVSGGEIVVQ